MTLKIERIRSRIRLSGEFRSEHLDQVRAEIELCESPAVLDLEELITHPAFIIHGNKDIVVGPINALILAEHLPNAQLIVYSDSSHGAQFQHAKTFLQHLNLFLSEGASQISDADSVSGKSSVALAK